MVDATQRPPPPAEDAGPSESGVRATRLVSGASSDIEGLNEADSDALGYLTALLPACALGVDIGGTVGKCVFLVGDDAALSKGDGGGPHPDLLQKKRFGVTGQRVADLDLTSPQLGGRLYFVKWETRRVQPFCDRVRDERTRAAENTPDNGALPPQQQSPRSRHDLFATGGGAFKFEAALQSTLGVSYHKLPEFDALVLGLRYLLDAHPDTVYTITDKQKVPAVFTRSQYPIAVCNIGSGVSVLRINEDGSFQRLGGTSIGGSTFYGLCKLIIGAESTFEDCLRLAHEGDPSEVDITVGDIYGEAGARVLGLPLLAPASSFGKLVSMDEEQVQDLPKAALAASILAMTTQAIQQIAMGLAKKGECSTVFFTGGFLRGNELSQTKLCDFARLVGEEAYFLRHSEFAGALGCLWKTYEKKVRKLPSSPSHT